MALIDSPPVIRRILSHLGLPTDVPGTRPARPPPLHPTSRGEVGAPALPIGRSDLSYDDDIAVP